MWELDLYILDTDVFSMQIFYTEFSACCTHFLSHTIFWTMYSKGNMIWTTCVI